MTWTYHQASGNLFRAGRYVDKGCSGAGVAKNHPEQQALADQGPIPRGSYVIQAPVTHPVTGPMTLRLVAEPMTRTFGRTGFMIHGDGSDHLGRASTGCVVLRLSTRRLIWSSGDHSLEVVP